MSYVVAIDLGKVTSGIAVFEGGTLTNATEVVALRHDMAGALARLAKDWTTGTYDCEGQVWVWERMKKYGARGARDRALDDLAALGDVLGRHVRALGGKVVTYTASQWKASVPKSIHHTRILAQLTPDEYKRIEIKGKESLDAIGLGLFNLKRMGRGKK